MAIVKNESSFSQVIRTNVNLLKFSGTIPPEDKTLPKMVLSYCLTIISVAVLAIHTSAYAYDFINHAAYIETAIESFALIISLFGGLVRNLILYLSRGKIQRMLNTLEDLWKILNTKERFFVTLYIKGTINLTYFFLSQCIFTILFYAIAPLFTNQQSADGNLSINATRVLPYAFFSDVHQSPYYEILYFLQVSSMFNVGFTCVGVDMIGPLLITTVCGHLRVIQEQLRSMDRQVEIQSSRITDGSVFQVHQEDRQAINERPETGKSHSLESLSSELRSCVNYHRTILAICTEIEELTNIIFLTQLVGSTYILSTVGFKLAGDDQDKYKYFSQIIIGIVQLLICNWPPDVLLRESQAVADAAYFASWYQWPMRLKKSVHIVILRAQKPIQMTAGRFMDLSLETFATMISSAVSFFTMLRSLN